MIEEELFPQDINLQLTVGVEKMGPDLVSISVPKELRLTPKTFAVIQTLLGEQGFQLGNMNISAEHTEEIKELPNVVLADKESSK